MAPKFFARIAAMKTALLLIAHGSRQPEANADLQHLAALLRQRGGYDLVEASLFWSWRSIDPEAGARCVRQGARRVVCCRISCRQAST